MEVFFAALIGIVWFGLIIGSGIYAAVSFEDCSPLRGTIFAVLAIVLLAAFFAVIAHDANRLCARGHEQYQLVGKVIQRVWVCDEYAEKP